MGDENVLGHGRHVAGLVPGAGVFVEDRSDSREGRLITLLGPREQLLGQLRLRNADVTGYGGRFTHVVASTVPDGGDDTRS